jgi:uncharacterized protein (TIGR02466 family)
MINIDPWSPIILKDNCPVQEWSSIKVKCDNVLTQIGTDPTNNSYLETGDALSSVISKDRPYMWDDFNYFKEWLSPRLDEAVTKWKLNYNRYAIAGSWVNIHNKTGKTSIHCHRGCDIVVVYYLNVPPNSGRLIVRDPLEYHWANSVSHERGYLDSRGGYPIEVQTGDVIIFPGWLYHGTEESNSEDPRYIMSINYTGTST